MFSHHSLDFSCFTIAFSCFSRFLLAWPAWANGGIREAPQLLNLHGQLGQRRHQRGSPSALAWPAWVSRGIREAPQLLNFDGHPLARKKPARLPIRAGLGPQLLDVDGQPESAKEPARVPISAGRANGKREKHGSMKNKSERINSQTVV